MEKLDFTNDEQFKALEKMAYTGTLEVERFPMAEYKYFTELRKIYYAFKFEGLTKERTEFFKKQIHNEYLENKKTHDYYMKVTGTYQANLLKTSDLRAKVNKSEDLVEIASLCCEAVTLLTGDDLFYELNGKKIKRLGGQP